MEKPATPNALPQDKTSSTQNQKRKLPSPQELITHYESQGLDSQQASIKVIEDLQNALFRVITSGRGKKDKFMAETSRKIDAANTRLAVLDMKVDSKPGFGETFAIGVASGVTLKGIGSVMPHVLRALGQIWNSVKTATKTSP
ncbi:Ribosomal-like protein, putative [Fagus crenata]